MLNKNLFFSFILFVIVIVLPNGIWAKTDKSVQSAEINRFYDDLMELVSYNKYRDFYERYLEEVDISYDNFLKEITQRGIGISGGYDSKLIGWQRKGKRIILTIDSYIKGKNKRVQLILLEKKEGLKISSKEFFNKICESKKGARRKK